MRITHKLSHRLLGGHPLNAVTTPLFRLIRPSSLSNRCWVILGFCCELLRKLSGVLFSNERLIGSYQTHLTYYGLDSETALEYHSTAALGNTPVAFSLLILTTIPIGAFSLSDEMPS